MLWLSQPSVAYFVFTCVTVEQMGVNTQVNTPVGPGYFPPMITSEWTDLVWGVGCWNSWMTICQSRISPFAGRQVFISIPPWHERNKVSKKSKTNKKDTRFNSVKSCRGGGEKGDPHHRWEATNPWRTVVQPSRGCAARRRRWEPGRSGGIFTFFLTTPGEDRNTRISLQHLTVRALCFPKCLRNVYESGAV